MHEIQRDQRLVAAGLAVHLDGRDVAANSASAAPDAAVDAPADKGRLKAMHGHALLPQPILDVALGIAKDGAVRKVAGPPCWASCIWKFVCSRQVRPCAQAVTQCKLVAQATKVIGFAGIHQLTS